jgi:hypothetical protein
VTAAIWNWVPSLKTLSSAKLLTDVLGPLAAYGSTAYAALEAYYAEFEAPADD